MLIKSESSRCLCLLLFIVSFYLTPYPNLSSPETPFSDPHFQNLIIPIIATFTLSFKTMAMSLSFSFSFLFSVLFFISLFSLFIPLFADVDSRITPPPPPTTGHITTSSLSWNPSPSPPSIAESSSPFRPSVAIIVGLLTIILSLTFLLLLYAKHCKSGGMGDINNIDPNYRASAAARKNSGIDRAVIESLPLFRFSSLSGQKEGLECAVCLTRFEGTEVLRLLPKCKHAFHVECVDTWLDAHSTCPLCRYRVDPEDILLIENTTSASSSLLPPPPPQKVREGEAGEPNSLDIESVRGVAELQGFRQFSSRHSSAGERASEWDLGSALSQHVAASFRRSLDSSRKKTVSVGCFERPRKDELLLTVDDKRPTSTRNVEHQIIVSKAGGGGLGYEQRWSDVQPSDLLYLRSEMIISDSRRLALASGCRSSNITIDEDGGGRGVINSRSVSEITGLSRFCNTYRGGGECGGRSSINDFRNDSSRSNINSSPERERQAGVVSRWTAWISSLPPVQSETAHAQPISV